MKFFAVLASVALAASATTLSTPTRRVDDIPNNGLLDLPLDSPLAGGATAPAPRTISGLTNAERFARGLPPAAPHRRSRSKRLTTSGTPPIPVAGKLSLINDLGVTVGYVATNLNVNRRYGMTQDISDALPVVFSIPSNGDPFDIHQLGGDPLPEFAAVVGPASSSNNLLPGSANYALLVTSEHTAPYAPPQLVSNSYSSAPAESAIWKLDIPSSTFTPTWVNDDGLNAPTSLVYLAGSDALLLTGDPVAFGNAFPGSIVVTLKLI
ncbi:hypothetical protein C8J57DRAFT_1497616 [Mycena rebaudengoi]|nr:hypothetical protein C8J57DRAFT_1497616 [Mycena rebaudengoi]